MADVVSKAKRSEMMAGIRGKNTNPELVIRRMLFSLGYRYRLHVKELAGKPDIVLPRYKTIICVHGCFWHGHGCHLFKWPSSRREFWTTKIRRNRNNDKKSLRLLKAQGWKTVVLWECAIKGKNRLPPDTIAGKIKACLTHNRHAEITGRTKTRAVR